MEEIIKNDADFASYCKDMLQLKPVDICSYSPLALAYIGDAVYELVVRTRVMNQGSMQVNKMHRRSSDLVNAKTQAILAKLLSEEFSREEQAVFKRGRNAKSVTTAKNASVIDYRMATGIEALFGYLYLTGQRERLISLISTGFKKIGELE